MTQKIADRVKVAWEIVKGVGIGIGVFIGTGILQYQKKTYDWQIMVTNQVQQLESARSTHATLISTRQEYESRNDGKNALQDKQLTFLFARFHLPLIER